MFNLSLSNQFITSAKKFLKLDNNDILKKNEKDIAAIVDELTKTITFFDWAYYVESSTLIEDYDYDQLFKKLQFLESNFPQFKDKDSPTQRVARGLSDAFVTVKHLIPMLSLDNSYNAEDLNDFDRRVKELSKKNDIDYCVEPKFDGGSIALVYENNLLVRAATRGNGTEGDEITNNAKVIRSIPLAADFKAKGIYKIELRGEVVINKSNFELLNISRKKVNDKLRKQGKKELELFKNSRNTASGGLRAKDSEITAKRKLEAFIYQIGVAYDKDGKDITSKILNSQHDNINYLESLGFKVANKEKLLTNDIEEVLKHCLNWEEKRENYQYDIDGMVIKVDTVALQNKIGSTGHHPRWAIAYKFKAKQGKAKLYNIDFQIGRTGAVTPVARICNYESYELIKDQDPAEVNSDSLEGLNLAGVEIKNISLHNEEFISEKDIRIGDTVIVERAGDVIPYIKAVDSSERNGKEETFIFPTHCICDQQSVLEKPEDESVWRCVSETCPFQLEERIIHFVSKNAMNIEGLGKDIIKRFIKEDILHSIEDIYSLDYDKILKLEGWKERSVNNLKSEIEKSKNNELWRLIVGLGIRHVGSTTAKMLSKQIDNLLDFVNWEDENYREINDIGPKVALSLKKFFNTEKNIRLLNVFREKNINFAGDKSDIINNSLFSGKTFLFTGTLNELTRNEAKELVEKNGGRNISAVSKNLNYLVYGEKAGSKLKKAKDISTINLLTEKEFIEMLNS